MVLVPTRSGSFIPAKPRRPFSVKPLATTPARRKVRRCCTGWLKSASARPAESFRNRFATGPSSTSSTATDTKQRAPIDPWYNLVESAPVPGLTVSLFSAAERRDVGRPRDRFEPVRCHDSGDTRRVAPTRILLRNENRSAVLAHCWIDRRPFEFSSDSRPVRSRSSQQGPLRACSLWSLYVPKGGNCRIS